MTRLRPKPANCHPYLGLLSRSLNKIINYTRLIVSHYALHHRQFIDTINRSWQHASSSFSVFKSKLYCSLS